METETDTTNDVMLANPQNVYRTSTNIVIRTLSQDKHGKWIEDRTPMLIPSGWYLTSGSGL